MKPDQYFDFTTRETLTQSVLNARPEVRKHLGPARYQAIREAFLALLDAESHPGLTVDQRAALREARPRKYIVIAFTLVAAGVPPSGVVAYLTRYPQVLPARTPSNLSRCCVWIVWLHKQ